MTEVLELRVLLADGHQLIVVGLDGREAISQLFEIDVDVVCEVGESLPDNAGPGSDATLIFLRGGDEVRRIHGFVASVSHRVDNTSDNPRYRLRVVPHAARATLVKTQQIFLDMTVVEIIAHKLELIGLTGDALSLVGLGSYPKRDFVVQYQETDLAFISRLAEHLGISFYFDQVGDTDQIVFADGHDDFAHHGQTASVQLTKTLNEPDHIYELERTEQIVPSSYVVYDYNYRRPDLWLVGSQDMDSGHGGGVLENACHVKDEQAATALAKIRSEEILCRQHRYRGRSSIVGMAAGGLTTLEASDAFDETPLLITVVHHRLRADGGDRTQLHYDNVFEAIETTYPFRPERRTPHPRIHGFVTGTVQGIPGVEADGTQTALLDAEGRYAVQLHFDAVLGDPHSKGSHWVRMAQPFGGRGHGMHFPLRPGVEVMVAFANGDPDRPVIVGAIPNAHTGTPVTETNASQNRITAASGAIFEISERR